MASTVGYKVWDRYWKVEVETTPDYFEVFESPDFWVEFDVKYDTVSSSLTTQNKATITLYNVSPSIVEIVKPDNRINLSVGYADNQSMIFRGLVKGITSKRRGGDVYYKIKCVPDTNTELEKFVLLKTFPPEAGKPDWLTSGEHIIKTLINTFTTLQVKYITDSAANTQITNYTAVGTLGDVLERLAAEITSLTGIRYTFGVIPQLGWFFFAEEGENWGDEIYIMHDIYTTGTEVITRTSPVSAGEATTEALEEVEVEEGTTTTNQYRVLEMPLNPSVQIGKVLKYRTSDGSEKTVNPVYVEHLHDGQRFVTIVKEQMT